MGFHFFVCKKNIQRLIGADGHALLVVAGGLIVGVDDGVGGHAVGVVGLGPGVDGVDIIELGHHEDSEHRDPAQDKTGQHQGPPAHENSLTTQHAAAPPPAAAGRGRVTQSTRPGRLRGAHAGQLAPAAGSAADSAAVAAACRGAAAAAAAAAAPAVRPAACVLRCPLQCCLSFRPPVFRIKLLGAENSTRRRASSQLQPAVFSCVLCGRCTARAAAASRLCAGHSRIGYRVEFLARPFLEPAIFVESIWPKPLLCPNVREGIVDGLSSFLEGPQNLRSVRPIPRPVFLLGAARTHRQATPQRSVAV